MNNTSEEIIPHIPEQGFPLLQFASDCSILIKAGEGISEDCHTEVFRIFTLLTSNKIEVIQDPPRIGFRAGYFRSGYN